MVEKYETLLEKAVKAMEQNANIYSSMLDVSKSIDNNLKDLNEKFVYHCTNANDIKKDTDLIKLELLKWLKILGIALLLAVGGKTIIDGVVAYLTK